MSSEDPYRGTKDFSNAMFQHDRPQQLNVPTAAKLARRHMDSLDVFEPGAHSTQDPRPSTSAQAPIPVPPHDKSYQYSVTVHRGCPWPGFRKLGVLIQGASQLSLCATKGESCGLVMFKELDVDQGRNELETLQQISHPNIIKLRQAFEQNSSIFIGFEYYRCTLQEMLHVHISLEEPHVKAIAKSVRCPKIKLDID